MRTLTTSTRQRIFDAAARLFADRRFHEVRMEDLAAEAGVGKGTLYRYFQDKEDLYRDLIVTAAKQIQRDVEIRMAEADAPQAKLEAAVASMIDYIDRHPYFFELLQHVEALNPTGRGLPWPKMRKEMVTSIADVLATPPLLCRQPELTALMLLGTIRSVDRFGKRPRPTDLANSIVTTFLFGAAAK